jgi:hypothetical protein
MIHIFLLFFFYSSFSSSSSSPFTSSFSSSSSPFTSSSFSSGGIENKERKKGNSYGCLNVFDVEQMGDGVEEV